MGLRKNVAGQKIAFFLSQQTASAPYYDFGPGTLGATWASGQISAANFFQSGNVKDRKSVV